MVMSEEDRSNEVFALLTAIVIQDLIDNGLKEKVFTINIPDHLETEYFSIGIVFRDSKEIKIQANLIKGSYEPESTRNVPKGYH